MKRAALEYLKSALIIWPPMAMLLLVVLWAEPTHQDIAHRIALALAADPHVVLEIRPQGDGTFRAVLAPEVVEGTVLKVLEEK